MAKTTKEIILPVIEGMPEGTIVWKLMSRAITREEMIILLLDNDPIAERYLDTVFDIATLIVKNAAKHRKPRNAEE